jgi:hypothetical protein
MLKLQFRRLRKTKDRKKDEKLPARNQQVFFGTTHKRTSQPGKNVEIPVKIIETASLHVHRRQY